MNLRKKVSKTSFYTEYIKTLNGILRLSPREVEVLSFLVAEDATGQWDNINGTAVRKRVMAGLGINEYNLSKHLHNIKAKGLILPVAGKPRHWVLNDYIRPNIVGGLFELTITFDISDGSNTGGEDTQGSTQETSS